MERRVVPLRCGVVVATLCATSLFGIAEDSRLELSVARAHYNGRQIIGFVGKDLYEWDARSGKQIVRVENALDPLLGVKLNRRDLTGLASAGEVKPRDPHYNEDDALLSSVTSLRWPHPVSGVSVERIPLRFSPDGKFYLSAYPGQKQIWLRDVGWGYMDFILSGIDADFNPTGSQVLEVEANSVTLWDLPSLDQATGIVSPAAGVTFLSARFSQDGRSILTGCSDRTVRIWDVASGREMRKLRIPTGDITAAYFTDSFTVLTGSTDGAIRIWDAKTGNPVQTFKNSGPVRQVLVGLDGRHCIAKWSSSDRPDDCAVVGSTVWDLSTRKEIVRLNREESDCLAGFGTADQEFCSVVGQTAIFRNTINGGAWKVKLEIGIPAKR